MANASIRYGIQGYEILNPWLKKHIVSWSLVSTQQRISRSKVVGRIRIHDVACALEMDGCAW